MGPEAESPGKPTPAGMPPRVLATPKEGPVVSLIVSAYSKILQFIKSWINGEASATVKDSTGVRAGDSVEVIRDKAVTHLSAVSKSFDSLCHVAVSIDEVRKSKAVSLDPALEKELGELTDKVEMIFNLPDITEESLRFKGLVREAIASALSRIVIESLIEKVKQKDIASREEAKEYLRAQLNSMLNTDLPFEEDLAALLGKSPVRPGDFSELIIREDRDIRVLLPMMTQVFLKVMNFIRSKIESSLESGHGEIDISMLNQSLGYISRLRLEMNGCRNAYFRIGRAIQFQNHDKSKKSVNIVKPAKPAKSNQKPADIEAKPAITPRVAAAVSESSYSNLDSKKEILIDSIVNFSKMTSVYNKKSKPSDIMIHIGGNKNKIISYSIKIVEELGKEKALSDPTKEKLSKQLDIVMELVLRVIGKQMMVDAPMTAMALIELIQKNIESSLKYKEGKSAALAKIVGSVLLYADESLWS